MQDKVPVEAAQLTQLSVLFTNGGWMPLLDLMSYLQAPRLTNLTLAISRRTEGVQSWRIDDGRSFGLATVKTIIVDLDDDDGEYYSHMDHDESEQEFYYYAFEVLKRFHHVQVLDVNVAHLSHLYDALSDARAFRQVQRLALRNAHVRQGDTWVDCLGGLLETFPRVRTLLMNKPLDEWNRHPINKTVERGGRRLIWEPRGKGTTRFGYEDWGERPDEEDS